LFPAAEATSSNVREERLIGNKALSIVQHQELAFESTLLAAVEGKTLDKVANSLSWFISLGFGSATQP
jgi:hypothetical protein